MGDVSGGRGSLRWFTMPESSLRWCRYPAKWYHSSAQVYALFVPRTVFQESARSFMDFKSSRATITLARNTLRAMQVWSTIVGIKATTPGERHRYVWQAERHSRDPLFPTMITCITEVPDVSGRSVAGFLLHFSHAQAMDQHSDVDPMFGEKAEKKDREKKYAERKSLFEPDYILEHALFSNDKEAADAVTKGTAKAMSDRGKSRSDVPAGGRAPSTSSAAAAAARRAAASSSSGGALVDGDAQAIGESDTDVLPFLRYATRPLWKEVAFSIDPSIKRSLDKLAQADFDITNFLCSISAQKVFSMQVACAAMKRAGAHRDFTRLDAWIRPDADVRVHETNITFPRGGEFTYRVEPTEVGSSNLFTHYFPSRRRPTFRPEDECVRVRVAQMVPAHVLETSKSDPMSASEVARATAQVIAELTASGSVDTTDHSINGFIAHSRAYMRQFLHRRGHVAKFEQQKARASAQLRMLREFHEVWEPDGGIPSADRAICRWIRDYLGKKKTFFRDEESIRQTHVNLTAFEDMLVSEISVLETDFEAFQVHKEALVAWSLCCHVYFLEKMQPNCLFHGPPEAGKSFICKLLSDFFIKDTFTVLTSQSGMADIAESYGVTNSDVHNMIFLMEEIPGRILGVIESAAAGMRGAMNTGNTAECERFRDQLTRGIIDYKRLVKNEHGGLEKRRIQVLINAVYVGMTNYGKSQIPHSMWTRFCNMFVSGKDMRSDGTMLLEKVTREKTTMTQQMINFCEDLQWNQALICVLSNYINCGIIEGPDLTVSDSIGLVVLGHLAKAGSATAKEPRNLLRYRAMCRILTMRKSLLLLLGMAPTACAATKVWDWAFLLNIEPLMVSEASTAVLALTMLSEQWVESHLQPFMKELTKACQGTVAPGVPGSPSLSKKALKDHTAAIENCDRLIHDVRGIVDAIEQMRATITDENKQSVKDTIDSYNDDLIKKRAAAQAAMIVMKQRKIEIGRQERDLQEALIPRPVAGTSTPRAVAAAAAAAAAAPPAGLPSPLEIAALSAVEEKKYDGGVDDTLFDEAEIHGTVLIGAPGAAAAAAPATVQTTLDHTARRVYEFKMEDPIAVPQWGRGRGGEPPPGDGKSFYSNLEPTALQRADHLVRTLWKGGVSGPPADLITLVQSWLSLNVEVVPGQPERKIPALEFKRIEAQSDGSGERVTQRFVRVLIAKTFMESTSSNVSILEDGLMRVLASDHMPIRSYLTGHTAEGEPWRYVLIRPEQITAERAKLSKKGADERKLRFTNHTYVDHNVSASVGSRYGYDGEPTAEDEEVKHMETVALDFKSGLRRDARWLEVDGPVEEWALQNRLTTISWGPKRILELGWHKSVNRTEKMMLPSNYNAFWLRFSKPEPTAIYPIQRRTAATGLCDTSTLSVRKDTLRIAMERKRELASLEGNEDDDGDDDVDDDESNPDLIGAETKAHSLEEEEKAHTEHAAIVSEIKEAVRRQLVASRKREEEIKKRRATVIRETTCGWGRMPVLPPVSIADDERSRGVSAPAVLNRSQSAPSLSSMWSHAEFPAAAADREDDDDARRETEEEEADRLAEQVDEKAEEEYFTYMRRAMGAKPPPAAPPAAAADDIEAVLAAQSAAAAERERQEEEFAARARAEEAPPLEAEEAKTERPRKLTVRKHARDSSSSSSTAVDDDEPLPRLKRRRSTSLNDEDEGETDFVN